MNWIRRMALIGFIGLSAISCAPVELSPREQAEQTKIANTPLIFTIEKSKSDETWGRAQVWLTSYASYKIQTATDYVLQTFAPVESNSDDYAYEVTRLPGGTSDTFTVKCVAGSAWLYGDNALMNAKVFAHYLQTGTMIGWLMTPAR